MFNTILWATDGSPCSDDALGTVRRLCERYGSSLRIVHVVQQFGGEHFTGPDLIPDEDRVIAKLKAQTSALRRHGIDASLHVIRGAVGSPAGHIVDMVRMVAADLIVVGVRGRSALESVLLGSVTLRLLTIAQCPVLVVPASVASTSRAATHRASGVRRAAVTA
jgi:nucleotide-binding universal stress UspA family protein